MSSYNKLSLFPDVPPLFDHLRSSSHIYPVIFSNGTMSMISTTLSQSPGISTRVDLFKDVVVVEPIKTFKPCPEVYEHLCKQVGKEGNGERKDVWLISSNPFDVVGANACGMSTCWVDRSGLGWVDAAVEGHEGKPNVIVRGLDEVVEKIGSLVL
jgi:2-haloacid dehalogenase